MKNYNKTTISVLVGSAVTVAATFFPEFFSPEVQGSVQTLVVSAFVYFVGNA